MRKSRALILAVLVAAATVGCASVSTEPDQVGLAYTGGPIEGVKFDKVIGPGSGLVWLGVMDGSFTYPTTTRDYTVSDTPNEADSPNAGAIACPVEGVETRWEMSVYFKLNTTKIRAFHENVGLKFKAYNGGDDGRGWDAMLDRQLKQQLINSVQQSCRSHTLDEIQKSAEVFSKLNAEIARGLKDQINTAMGDDYFCGPEFTGGIAENDSGTECPDLQVAVKSVSIPNEAVRASYDQQKASSNQLVTRQNEAAAKIAEAQGTADAQAKLNGIYNDPAYIAYLRALAMGECARNPQCTLVVSDGGDGNVNINAGR